MDNYSNYRALGEYDGDKVSENEDLDFEPCEHEDHEEDDCPAKRITQ